MKKKWLVLIQSCNRHATRAKVNEARRMSATRTSCTLPAVRECLLAKAPVETRKERRKWCESKGVEEGAGR